MKGTGSSWSYHGSIIFAVLVLLQLHRPTVSATEDKIADSSPGTSTSSEIKQASIQQTPLIISQGSNLRKEVALTFDDGPHPVLTLQLLDILRAHRVKATFFVLGERVKLYPWTLQRIVDEGHEIGNHSYSHRSFLHLSPDSIRQEIDQTQEIIKFTVGFEPLLFRPPYGSYRESTRELCTEDHLEMVLWSVDSEDWKLRDPDMVYHEIMSQVRNGSIILCHDIHPTTIQAMSRVIESLQEDGYEFKTVSEIIDAKLRMQQELASHHENNPIRNH